jgi:purine nucleoside permease
VRELPARCRFATSAAATSIARVRVDRLIAVLAVGSGVAATPADVATAQPAAHVLVIAPTPAEIQPWIDRYALTASLAIPGLSPSAPAVLCNAGGVCAVATGAGKANAAASIAAIAYSGQLDLSATYFVIAERARIDPSQGTTSSAVWIHDVADVGIAQEIDARTLPSGWTTGYVGIEATSPTSPPLVQFGTEHYALDASLVAKAVSLSSGVALEDSDAARAYRAMYGSGAAIAAPSVMQGTTASSDTIWHGALLGQRAHDWVAEVAGSGAVYTTMQQNDNGAIAALVAAGNAGLLDAKRIAVLHSIAGFDRPYPSQTAYDSLVADAGAGSSSIDNLVVAGAPLVDDIVANWSSWQSGVPQ